MPKAKNDTVYTNFAPTSATLVPLAGAFDKAQTAASEALEKVRVSVFKALVANKTLTGDLEQRFRVGKKWGQWSWWVQPEASSKTSTKGMDL